MTSPAVPPGPAPIAVGPHRHLADRRARTAGQSPGVPL